MTEPLPFNMGALPPSITYGDSIIPVDFLDKDPAKTSFAYGFDVAACESLRSNGVEEPRGFNQAINLIRDLLGQPSFYEKIGCRQPQSIKLEPFTGGRKYAIVRVIVSDGEMDHDLVIHCPRSVDNHIEIVQDFEELSKLAETAETVLTERAKSEFQVLKPIGAFETSTDRDNAPLLVTPYLGDEPFEIGIFRHRSGMNMIVPAYPRCPEHKDLTREAAKRATSGKTNDIDALVRQNKSLLRVTTLMWLLMGRKLPSEFQICAGDLMYNPKKESRQGQDKSEPPQFTLTTIRGGQYIDLPTLLSLLGHLKYHVDGTPALDDDTGHQIGIIRPYEVFTYTVFDPSIVFNGDSGDANFDTGKGRLYPLTRLLSDVREMINPEHLNIIYPKDLSDKDLKAVNAIHRGVEI